MKDRVKLILAGSLILIGLVFCSLWNKKDNTQRADKIMEDMQYLYADNTYGYYFDIYSDITRDKDKDGVIKLENSLDNMYLMIENAGKERNIAIQILVDYIQVPILIDNTEYFTYYVSADSHHSEEICFRLKEELDENIDHKLMALMTISADTNAKDREGEHTSNDYSLAYDLILTFEGKENNTLAESQYQYTDSIEIYEDMWHGLLINNDITDFKRSVPPKEIVVNVNEQIELQYQVGGYNDCEDVVFVLLLGMQQIKVNGQNYIYCKTENNKISKGTITIQVPSEPGLYDLTGWVVKNPFDEKIECIPLDATYRFTINAME